MSEGPTDDAPVTLGHHDGRPEFWQINIGHVLTLVAMLLSGGGTMIGGIYALAELRVQYADQKDAITDLKSAVGDIRAWRERQDAENAAWHTQINQSFDTVNRHLERLDWLVGPRNDADMPPARRH